MNKSARAIRERICVLTMALFRRHTLCISRKSDEVRAQIVRKAPRRFVQRLPMQDKHLKGGSLRPQKYHLSLLTGVLSS